MWETEAILSKPGVKETYMIRWADKAVYIYKNQTNENNNAKKAYNMMGGNRNRKKNSSWKLNQALQKNDKHNTNSD